METKEIIEFELDKEDIELLKEASENGFASIELNKNLNQLILYPFEDQIDNFHYFGKLLDCDSHINLYPSYSNDIIEFFSIGKNTIELMDDGSAILRRNSKRKIRIDSFQIEKIPERIRFISDPQLISQDLYYHYPIYEDLESNNFFELKLRFEDALLEEFRDAEDYRYDRIEFDRMAFLREFLEKRYDYLLGLLKTASLDEANQIKRGIESIEKRQDSLTYTFPSKNP
jgi:hypothetical protein